MVETAENPRAVTGNNRGVLDDPVAKQLQAYVERVERLDEDAAQIREDRKDVLAEAKGVGFDTKIIRKLVALRKQDADKRREEQELLELYGRALGMSIFD